MANSNNEVFVKLRDKSGSFYDPTQGKGVVRDRVALLKRTSYVSQFIHAQQLIELSDEVGQSEFDAQNPVAVPATPGDHGGTAPVAALVKEEATEADKPAAKKAVAVKKAAPLKKAAAPIKEVPESDDDDDDDEDEAPAPKKKAAVADDDDDDE